MKQTNIKTLTNFIHFYATCRENLGQLIGSNTASPEDILIRRGAVKSIQLEFEKSMMRLEAEVAELRSRGV